MRSSATRNLSSWRSSARRRARERRPVRGPRQVLRPDQGRRLGRAGRKLAPVHRPEPTEEEHVTVRGEPERGRERAAADRCRRRPVFEDEDDDDGGDWYDTASLEPVGQALGGTVEAARTDDEPIAGSGGAGGTRTTSKPTSSPRPRRTSDAAADEWPVGGRQRGTRPSEEELEEAAAHFADPSAMRRLEASGASRRADRRGQRRRPDGGAGRGAVPRGRGEDEDVFAAMAEEEPSADDRRRRGGTRRPQLAGAGGGRGRSRPRPPRDRAGRARRVPHGIVLAGVALVALLIGEGVFAVFAALVAARRAGRAVRRDGEAPPPTRHRGRTRERRAGPRGRVLPRRGRARCRCSRSACSPPSSGT